MVNCKFCDSHAYEMDISLVDIIKLAIVSDRQLRYFAFSLFGRGRVSELSLLNGILLQFSILRFRLC